MHANDYHGGERGKEVGRARVVHWFPNELWLYLAVGCKTRNWRKKARPLINCKLTGVVSIGN